MVHAPEEKIIDVLGPPEIGYVQRKDNKRLEPGIPEYIIRPASYKKLPSVLSHPIKIIDFGESFLPTTIPQTLHTPLAVRAPEVIFGDCLDHRVYLWSMGCMLVELFVGQPPFSSMMATPPSVAGEMREIISDPLPERWQDSWNAMKDRASADELGFTLQILLEDLYFDEDKNQNLTAEDISKLGVIVGKMLRFEPSTRASAKEILNDPWFREERMTKDFRGFYVHKRDSEVLS